MEYVVVACSYCDFSGGTRGMDRCAKCDGTGSQLLVNGELYPNTEDGWAKAVKLHKLQSGDQVEVHHVVVKLEEGMRVETYNRSGTLRHTIKVTTPSVMTINEEVTQG